MWRALLITARDLVLDRIDNNKPGTAYRSPRKTDLLARIQDLRAAPPCG